MLEHCELSDQFALDLVGDFLPTIKSASLPLNIRVFKSRFIVNQASASVLPPFTINTNPLILTSTSTQSLSTTETPDSPSGCPSKRLLYVDNVVVFF